MSAVPVARIPIDNSENREKNSNDDKAQPDPFFIPFPKWKLSRDRKELSEHVDGKTKY